MVVRKKQEEQRTAEAGRQTASFWVEPGKKVQVTVEFGEKIVDGKVPLTVQIEPLREQELLSADSLQSKRIQTEVLPPKPATPGAVSRLRAGFQAILENFKRYDLAKSLFILALTVYLGTRLVGLTRFPIYFFSDEAIQSQSVIDLMNNGYRDANGALFPTYFPNGRYYNIGLSVYLQWLPAVLFGKSAVATRATSIVVTLIAAASVGILLRDIFKLKYWWTGTLFLSITPAWFLHSRTAFETAEFVAFYAGTLCAYLFYRYKSARFLYLAIFLAALSFYSYSPAQIIMPLTALGLLVSDWRYHWENRREGMFGLALAALLALPYIRFVVSNPDIPFAHLHTLWSYWFEKIPLSQKFARYFSEFGIGLSPWYWYTPNDRDLARHLMKGYGNIMITTLPFALLGLAQALRRLNLPSYRAILIAFLVSPAAAALVQVSITRTLVFVVPAAILTAIGLELVLEWVAHPGANLEDLAASPAPNTRRLLAGGLILAAGIFLAFRSEQTINFFAILTLTILLALQLSGLLQRGARFLTRIRISSKFNGWRPSSMLLALSVFLVLSGMNVAMLNDALMNGPLWFRDYGLSGMQYGAFQIFDLIDDYLDKRPDTRIIFSPVWTNGADTVARFFLKDPFAVEVGSVNGHMTGKLPLDDNTLFIMTPEEYRVIMQSEKFTDITVERIVPYPDGNPGFYFIRLRYVDHIDEIFAAEKAARQALRESTVTMEGQEVKLRYSFVDGEPQEESIASLFDEDPYTLAKTFEANPFVIEMSFPKPRMLSGFSIIIGSAEVRITLKCYDKAGAQPVVHKFEGQGTQKQPELSFDLSTPIQVEVLKVEVLDIHAPDNEKIHIWELKLR